ncbi:MAG TPA: BON domain-containing protein [Bryobacteraceae bacterium]|nr:BON domain-containing protein [Bryobacteraceae bacterium]
MQSVIGIPILAALFLASGFAADSQKDHNDAFLPGPDNEAQMAKQIRHKLLTLPYYSIFTDLAFQLEPGGVVVLEGACPPEPPWDIKSDAERVVKKVPGVTKVVNNIKELPLSPMDWQIRRAVARAIYGESSIGMRYGYQALPSIHIIVDNGHVTLEGVVDNQFDDTLIRTRANSVPGVFSVTDNLRVTNENESKHEHKKGS